MSCRHYHLSRQIVVAALFQAQVKYRGGICQDTDSVCRHFVLTEKQLGCHERFDQLWLGIIKPTGFDKLDAGSQAPQPYSGVKQSASTHGIPMPIAEATCVVRLGHIAALIHQKKPPTPLTSTTTGIADAVETIKK